jgi:LPXTG-site transpeptidase (sortase) family protein
VRRSTVVICAGALILLAGALITLPPWLEAYRWQASPVAVQAERNAAAPLVEPVRPISTRVPRAEKAPAVLATRPPARPTELLAPATLVPVVMAPTPAVALGDEVVASPPDPAPEIGPTAALAPPDLHLTNVAFQFLDPPQPGATAVLSMLIENPTETPSQPVSLHLPTAWLTGYRIQGVVPLPIDGRLTGERVDSNLRLMVDGPAAGDVLELHVFVVTTDEVVDSPRLRVTDSLGREIGRAQPPTQAPPAEPGPVYSVDIPSLRMRAGVVQVDWEPPLFVVGQLRTSARVLQGNTVLIGHVHGAAGYNVFSQLDKVPVGERIVANSRGQAYEFVVTQTHVLPKDDVSPTLPTHSARLTLMTCAGEFNPLTGEYSDRLWIVAEPVDELATRTAAPARLTPPTSAFTLPLAGLGGTDADLARTFGGPVGETRASLAVYQRDGVEHQAQLVEVAPTAERRATLLLERARGGRLLALTMLCGARAP